MITPSGPDCLTNLYQNITFMVNHPDSKITMKDIYNMIPWEFDVYWDKFEKFKEFLVSQQSRG